MVNICKKILGCKCHCHLHGRSSCCPGGRNPCVHCDELKIKDKEAKLSLMQYLKDADSERLWQAIRNWSGYAFIFGGNNSDKSDAVDTFYKEGK